MSRIGAPVKIRDRSFVRFNKTCSLPIEIAGLVGCDLRRLHIDPANQNHIWISYKGFNAATPATPGHVFEVTYNPGAGTATWCPGMPQVEVPGLTIQSAERRLYAATTARVPGC